MTAVRIALLEPEVVDQIAAGEVVERPASVVKELVENALDAGARRIDIEVEEGGQRLIRVVDDGRGMSREELELAVQRHATSKLRRIEDLHGIRTMGFRGEGLSSIGAVCRFSLHSRGAADSVGWRLRLEGGQLLAAEPAARGPGTTVSVEQLFFNTPARLKFLKSTAAESAHISDTVSRLACAHPAVHFALRHGSRTVVELPPAADRLQRSRAVLGRRGERLLHAEYREHPVSAEICLTPPEQAMRTARQLVLLVNGRPVRDRALIQAVITGYGAVLPPGHYPQGVVYLDVDPAAVDVNVHPQKLEVRFAEPRLVFRTLQRCVAGAFDERAPGSRTYAVAAGPPEEEQRPGREPSGYQEQRRRIEEAARRFWSARAGPAAAAADAAAAYLPMPSDPVHEGCGEFGRLRVVGQVFGGYLLCEADDGLIVVGSAAARLRLLREKMKRALEAGAVPAQRLLIPATVELSDAQASQAREHTQLLERLGLELEPFGAAKWMVRAVPQPLRHMEPAELVPEMLAALAEQGGSGSIDQMLVRAVRPPDDGGDAVEQARHLLRALDETGLTVERDAVALDLSVTASREPPAALPVALRIGRAAIERRLAVGSSDSPPRAAERPVQERSTATTPEPDRR